MRGMCGCARFYFQSSRILVQIFLLPDSPRIKNDHSNRIRYDAFRLVFIWNRFDKGKAYSIKAACFLMIGIILGSFVPLGFLLGEPLYGVGLIFQFVYVSICSILNFIMLSLF
ncbi:hypothetical protein AWH48_02340 [Domibacillus aminovorans]|uniref:Uncharacterized protein n=1 Tax=Domibacillus aminovorans TaxID=29332 RepID=A0A177KZA9_9BACI|nr:hypothetical protein AWH48_02340 [Domibacillus aminovorans]